MSDKEIQIMKGTHPNGQLRFKLYALDYEILHREGGPAFRKWNEDGKLTHVKYWVNDNLHRVDGPACKRWIRDKNIYYELNFINHKLTRINGYVLRFYCNDELVHQI